MRKKMLYSMGLWALLLVLGMALTSCGGSDPKALAKQTYDLSRQTLFAEDMAKKAAAVEAKVAKLSEKDRAVYIEELSRLSGEDLSEDLSGEDLDGLFEAASEAVRALGSAAADVQEALGSAAADVQEALGSAAADAQEALDSAAADAQEALDSAAADAKKALDTAKKATDLFKSF